MKEIQIEHKAQEYDAYEDEIQLMDLMEVLWRWKYLVLIGTLLCTGVVAFVSFQMQKIYRVSTVLEPGIVHLDPYGRVVRMCKGQELMDLIDAGVFNQAILADLKAKGMSDLPQRLGFDMKQPKNSDILEVSYDTPNPEMGVKVLEGLNKAVLKSFTGVIERWKGQYATELTSKKRRSSELVEKIVRRKNTISSAEVQNSIKVSQIENKIGIAETRVATLEMEKNTETAKKKNDAFVLLAKIETKKKQIKNLNDRIGEVKHELAQIAENMNRLIEERDRFLSSASKGKQENSFASVMYITTVQQNIAYINSLRSSINDLQNQILQESLAIEQLETEIKDTELEKAKMEESIASQTKDLKMGIRDYQNEMESLKKGLEIEIGNVESEIKVLETERDSANEEIQQTELKRVNVENIQIRKTPTSSVNPVKPKIMLNVLLSLVIGLFLSVFLSFFLEALAKRKVGRDQ
ncbi:MAG: hypothetical protein U5R49_02025 [Deltaproteobacteria bacterium]|nr:hypothetical protein [Deltaproteobacteria bacterium]